MSAAKTVALRVAERAGTPLLLAAIVIVVTLIGTAGSSELERITLTMLVNLVVVVGLYVFVGNSGVLSFGHPAFMAVGAYVAGIVVTPVAFKAVLVPQLPEGLASFAASPLAATLIGGLVAGLFGALIALPLIRLSGLPASLATFAVLMVVYVVAKNWETFTNGAAGLAGIPGTLTVGGALAGACGAIAVAWWFQGTRVGLRLRASREDDVAAQATGIAIGRYRAAGLLVSAVIVGVAGAMHAQLAGSINPDAFFLQVTFMTLAMLVIGGIASLTGAVLGTLFVTVVSEGLSRLERGIDIGVTSITTGAGVGNVVLAVVLLLVLVLRPQGLTGGRELRLPLPTRDERRA